MPRTPRSAPRLSYAITARTAGWFASSAADAGVVTTSTGPRLASCTSSGVVSTVSPRNDVWTTSDEGTGLRSVDLEDGQKRLLRNLHGAHLLHPLLSFLLLLQQLALAADVAAIALRQ